MERNKFHYNKMIYKNVCTIVIKSSVVVFGFMLLAWFCYPELFRNIANHIPGGRAENYKIQDYRLGGDHLQVFYLAWKLKANLLQFRSLFIDPLTFASNIFPNYDFMIGVQYVLTGLMQIIFGNIIGYNLSITVLPLVLTFAFAQFLIRQITTSIYIQIIGSILIAIIPQRMIQMIGGHSGGFVYCLTPLFFGALLWGIKSPGRFCPGYLAGFTLLLTTISDEHQAYYFIIVSAIIFPVWFVQKIFKESGSFFRKTAAFLIHWQGLYLGLCIAIAYGLLIEHLYLSAGGKISASARSLDTIAAYSLPLNKYLRSKDGLDIGFHILKAIPVVGLLSIWGHGKYREDIRQFFLSPYFPFFIALPMTILLMVGIGPDWSQKSGVYEFFYSYLPFFKYQRIPGKIYGVVFVLLVILLSVLWKWLCEWRKSTTSNRRFNLPEVLILVSGFVVFFQLFEFVKFYALNRNKLRVVEMSVQSDKIFRHIRTNLSAQDIVLSLPITSGDVAEYDPKNLYLAYQTERRIAQGYSGGMPYFYLTSFWHLENLNRGEVTVLTRDYLLRNGISYFLLDLVSQERFGAKSLKDRLDKLSFLKTNHCTQEFCLYKIDTNILANYRGDLDPGWSTYQIWKQHPGRWMRGLASIPLWTVPLDLSSFKVFSWAEYPGIEEFHEQCIAVDFNPFLKRFSMWLIDQNRRVQIFRDTWEHHKNFYRTYGLITSRKFLFATKDSWRSEETPLAKYPDLGHYIINITPVERWRCN